ncbi:MAG: 23S rRNA (adenine(2503)-C(2))-methyltransferase RlmN [Bdellovibrionales bacterium]|nr:23S rRNA (adenine(2503)-C(2))-methyltransferase RlmN [Bdellovibrionales bacterium]
MVYFQSLTKSELAEMLLPLSRVKEERELRDHPELAAELGPKIEKKKQKQAELRAKQIFHWAYQRYVLDFDQMSDLAKDVREFLKQNITMFRLQETYAKQSDDGTYKFLWNLGDNKTIESVIIPAALKEKARHEVDEAFAEVSREKRAQPSVPLTKSKLFAGPAVKDVELDEDTWARLTACVSSQVGCAMACRFCLTGVQGLDRSLGVHEVVTQIHELRMRAPITNIVFMGMGEPLHNVANIAKACQILLDEDGMNFSKRKVTVSTSGLVPGIEELYSKTDVSLAISLNASNDEQRSQIMPVNKKWPIAKLLDACRAVDLGPHRRITFEYVLLKDFNDTAEDAHRVAKLLRGIPSKVNIIPFNEHSGSDFKRPSDETVMAFQKILIQAGYTATVRISRGRDILAACGQLRSLFGTARGTEKHRDFQAPGAVASVTNASLEASHLQGGI